MIPDIDFYETLPPGYRLAKREDFHIEGKSKIGMQYLVLGAFWKVYQVYTVSERLKGSRLDLFLKDDRVFVKDETTIV